VRAPHGGVAIDHRQQRVAVLRNVAQREILRDERMRQQPEGEEHERELQVRSGARDGHPRGAAVVRAGQRQHRLQRGDEQGEDERELSEFGQH
jgi:hypothetical protein